MNRDIPPRDYFPISPEAQARYQRQCYEAELLIRTAMSGNLRRRKPRAREYDWVFWLQLLIVCAAAVACAAIVAKAITT